MSSALIVAQVTVKIETLWTNRVVTEYRAEVKEGLPHGVKCLTRVCYTYAAVTEQLIGRLKELGLTGKLRLIRAIENPDGSVYSWEPNKAVEQIKAPTPTKKPVAPTHEESTVFDESLIPEF